MQIPGQTTRIRSFVFKSTFFIKARGRLTAKDDVFIGSVVTVVPAVASFESRDTLPVAALEFIGRALVFANVSAIRRFVAHIAAIVVTVTVE